jgi:uncharacterized membrane protein YidH (DUF202 family)
MLKYVAVETNDQKLRIEEENNSDPRVDLAVERTEYALERTQLAWIRTVITLLASGVALDKGIQAVHQARIGSGDALVKNAHMIGIYLSTIGTVLMLITTWKYMLRSRSLAKIKGARPALIPPAALASLLIIFLGIVVSLLQWVS